MGVSKNAGTPKWMVKKRKTLLKWMIWGETPLFFGNTHMCSVPLHPLHLLPLKIHWMPKMAKHIKNQSGGLPSKYMITQYTIFFHNYGPQKRPQAKMMFLCNLPQMYNLG